MTSFKSPLAVATAILAALSLMACAELLFDEGLARSERADEVAARLSAAPDARVLVLGNSVMWWGEPDGTSVAQVLAATLGQPVVNLAVPGARISHPDPAFADAGLDIRRQYRPRGWDWVVMEGGANDLGDECNCNRCPATLDQLVSADGMSGEWPQIVARARADGAGAVIVGYYQPPAGGGEDSLARCGDEFAILNARLERLAGSDPRIVYVSMEDVVDPANPAHYDPDRVHPSARSSRAIGRLIAAAIEQAPVRR